MLRYFLFFIAFLTIPCFVFAQSVSTEGWFPFQPEDDLASSLIDQGHWLDAPAGKHGFLKMEGDRFVFEDGTPIKFWGVNIASARPYVEAEIADRWTGFLKKYGVNAVRFHKFTRPALTGPTSTVLDEEMLKNMDYFHHKLREEGLYYGWSPIYGHKPLPGDSSRLLAYEEILNNGLTNHLQSSTIGLVNFAEDVQDLHIELLVNMLEHRNPHTGLRYADDPALAFVELQNEDNIYFATTQKVLESCPTYRRLLATKFCEWLEEKYHNHEGLIEAWGEENLRRAQKFYKDSSEWHLEKNNIAPIANHGLFGYEYYQSVEENRKVPQYLLDMERFLYEEQVKAYERQVKAIRATGYKGPLVASCWQAGGGISHYYNLHNDYVVGMIDRHNYFGGGTGHQLKPGKVKNIPMVSEPGSGLLNTGMQQVADRPFSLSEWMNLTPNEWLAEGAPIIAVYGMGLQGWDASFSFASNDPEITSTVESKNHGVYNVEAPTHIPLYPALANMIYRGDVKEGEILHTRHVHIPSLEEGNLGFAEKIKQGGDFKNIQSVVPNEALAIGRVAVAFSENFEQTPSPDLSDYWNQEEKIVYAHTGQLAWDYTDKGYITVNTPGTKGFIGFGGGKKIDLGDLEIRMDNPFAVVLVSSLEKDKNIAQANRLLITTIARARNSGMRYNDDKSQIQEVGEGPVLMEPVRAEVIFSDNGANYTVTVLDHIGKATKTVFQVGDGKIRLDGSTYQTIYYELRRSEK